MSKICIIPARGGSKRIPRKNIKMFLGKPIIAYSIESALKSNLFDEVMVSTDDEEIAIIARNYGATVPFLRSKDNADDYATTFDVIKEVLSKFKDDFNKIFSIACCIYATAPFINPEKLQLSYSKLIEEGYDTIFPIVRFSFPIQRAFKISDNSKLSFINPQHKLTRSQDLETSFHDAGQFYWFKIKKCIESNTLFTDNIGGLEVKETESQDIDNDEDWKLAEIKYEFLQSTK